MKVGFEMSHTLSRTSGLSNLCVVSRLNLTASQAGATFTVHYIMNLTFIQTSLGPKNMALYFCLSMQIITNLFHW